MLARKYRPATFDDLIGQDAMVRTISNAFATGRIPQAWILTGVRGVGKTTTARILARGLNYELPDGSVAAPTIRDAGARHPLRAPSSKAGTSTCWRWMRPPITASTTSARSTMPCATRRSIARYKVYILDEVHMLSNQAFNALLKTLEEPPPHAKFIFATTEIRARCRSRCCRAASASTCAGSMPTGWSPISKAFSPRRASTAEPEALALIARAAEGSVRDALSLLDQAISHAAGAVRAEDVRQMLGLADRSRIIDLFDALMRGDIARRARRTARPV